MDPVNIVLWEFVVLLVAQVPGVHDRPRVTGVLQPKGVPDLVDGHYEDVGVGALGIPEAVRLVVVEVDIAVVGEERVGQGPSYRGSKWRNITNSFMCVVFIYFIIIIP